MTNSQINFNDKNKFVVKHIIILTLVQNFVTLTIFYLRGNGLKKIYIFFTITNIYNFSNVKRPAVNILTTNYFVLHGLSMVDVQTTKN